VRGSLRLFGGARALCERVREQLQAAATTHLALTPTPLASLWFARADSGRCAASTSWPPGWRRCHSR
jgi:hypothetical protein